MSRSNHQEELRRLPHMSDIIDLKGVHRIGTDYLVEDIC